MAGQSTSVAPPAVNMDRLQPQMQPSWKEPQIHIATATGKSASSYYDICDFVPNNIEEEMVIGGPGDQQVIVKSGPKKTKLDNLSLTQWSIANVAILYKLVGEGKLPGPALMDYLSYSTKFYHLVQRCSLTSVLLFDREYRKLQADMGFQWGTYIQHLQLSTFSLETSSPSRVLQLNHCYQEKMLLMLLVLSRSKEGRRMGYAGILIHRRAVVTRNAGSSTLVLCLDANKNMQLTLTLKKKIEVEVQPLPV